MMPDAKVLRIENTSSFRLVVISLAYFKIDSKKERGSILELINIVYFEIFYDEKGQ